MPADVIILAAGLGARFGGSKQLATVGPGGETILEYSLFDARRAGARGAVLVIRPEMQDRIERELLARLSGHIDIRTAHQHNDPAREKPWGTAHAVLVGADRLAEDHASNEGFVVLNADDLYGRDAIDAAVQFLNDPGPDDHHALVTFPLGVTLSPSGPVSRAICVVRQDGTIGDLFEQQNLSSVDDTFATDRLPDQFDPALFFLLRNPVSMNCWAFRPGIRSVLRTAFDAFRAATSTESTSTNELYLPDVIRTGIRSGTFTVRALPNGTTWTGITHRDDLEVVRGRIRQLIDDGTYPERLWD